MSGGGECLGKGLCVGMKGENVERGNNQSHYLQHFPHPSQFNLITGRNEIKLEQKSKNSELHSLVSSTLTFIPGTASLTK